MLVREISACVCAHEVYRDLWRIDSQLWKDFWWLLFSIWKYCILYRRFFICIFCLGFTDDIGVCIRNRQLSTNHVDYNQTASVALFIFNWHPCNWDILINAYNYYWLYRANLIIIINTIAIKLHYSNNYVIWLYTTGRCFWFEVFICNYCWVVCIRTSYSENIVFHDYP